LSREMQNKQANALFRVFACGFYRIKGFSHSSARL